MLTQLRIGRSRLNDHRYTIGQVDSPQCLCHNPCESTKHYLLDCFLYNKERRTMMEQVLHLIPKFDTFTIKNKLDILLSGYKIDQIDYCRLNVSLQIIVQNFILKTKRFYTPVENE